MAPIAQLPLDHGRGDGGASTTTTKLLPLPAPLPTPTPAPAPNPTLRTPTTTTTTTTRRPKRTETTPASFGPSMTRAAATATTEALFIPTSTDSSTWHSLPLAFAVLPAVGGMLMTDGSAFVTDVMLLLLVAVFLHWLVKFPWEWYHASQLPRTTATVDVVAEKEMRRNELAALVCCFIGPVAGGWLLHAIRSQLSRPSEGLVSNFNMTVFVMAAELRPVAQVITLMRARALHLRGRVLAGEEGAPRGRIEELESRVERLRGEMEELGGSTELEALQRAVRRYEKKEALHAAQTESRFLEINTRLNDVIALAATATKQQEMLRPDPSLVALLVGGAYGALLMPFSVAWRVMALPARRAIEIVSTAAAAVRSGEQQQLQQLQQRGVRGRSVGRVKGKARLKGY